MNLILSSRNRNTLKEVRNACANPSKVKIVTLDLEKYENMNSKVEEAMLCFGAIDVLVNNGKSYNVKNGTFLIYHLGNEDKNVTLSFAIDKDAVLDIILNEISYDLLRNSNFSINPRSEEMMPMPFVTNDAIIIIKKIAL